MKRPLVLLAALALAVGLLPAPAQAATGHTRTTRWDSATTLAQGTFEGTRLDAGAIVLSKPTFTRTRTDPYAGGGAVTWSYGRWTSPWAASGSEAARLVPSWSAGVPDGTWMRVLARVKRGTTVGSWDLVGEWGFGPNGMRRASATAQPDDLTSVDVDTVKANPGGRFHGWQLRVELVRRPGSTATPRVRSVSGNVSSYATRSIPPSPTTMTRTTVLDVPSFSQMTHRGHFPQGGGGGEARCSPTAVAMLLRSFGSGPAPSQYSGWAGADGQVDHAARYSYDHRYEGTGNWGFSTAYASQYGMDAFVTRLSDLRDAEAFVKAGIPVVVSVRFGRGELTGAPISSTNGHLLVVSGFTADGRVVVNDPAGASNGAVRRTYSRAQLERAWLQGSGGITYVVRPPGTPLPKDTLRW